MKDDEEAHAIELVPIMADIQNEGGNRATDQEHDEEAVEFVKPLCEALPIVLGSRSNLVTAGQSFG